MNSKQQDALSQLLLALDEAIHAFTADPMHEEVATLSEQFIQDLRIELGDALPKRP